MGEYPLIVSDGAGGAFAAWRDMRTHALTGIDAVAQRITGAGTIASGWPPAGFPTAVLAESQDPTAPCPDGAGGMLVVCWDQRNGYPSENDIYVQRVRADGALAPGWPANGLLLIAGRHRLRVGADGSGGFYVETSTIDTTCYDDAEHYLQRHTFAGVPAAAPSWCGMSRQRPGERGSRPSASCWTVRWRCCCRW